MILPVLPILSILSILSIYLDRPAPRLTLSVNLVILFDRFANAGGSAE